MIPRPFPVLAWFAVLALTWCTGRVGADAPKAPAANKPPKAAADREGNPLPAGARARLGSVRLRHGTAVSWLGFARDGKTLASLGEGIFCRWETATGRPLRRLESPGKNVAFAALSPDGKLLATGGWEKTVGLWDVATGREVRRLQNRHPKDSTYYGADGLAAFSPDGKTLASVYAPGAIRLWQVATGKLLRELPLEKGKWHVECLAIAPGGKTLALGTGSDGWVRLYDVPTGRLTRRLRHGGPDVFSIYALAFSPDGKTLASGGVNESIVRRWDVATGKQLRPLQGSPDLIGGRVAALAFSPDGKTVAADGHRGVVLWQATTGRAVRSIRTPAGARVRALAFAPDGRSLAVGGDNGRVYLLDAATGKELLPPAASHEGVVWSLAFSPGGKLLASAAKDQTVRLWDPSTGKGLHRRDGHAGNKVTPLAFSPDGRLLAAGGKADTLVLQEPATGKEVRRFPFDYGPVQLNVEKGALAFAGDGRTLLTGTTTSATFRRREVPSGRVLHQFRYGPYNAACVAFSPDGKTLARAGRKAGPAREVVLQVWDTATGKEVRQFGEGLDFVTVVAWSPDGRLLASATYGDVRLWEAGTGKHLGTLTGARKMVQILAFSPDGLLLATGGGDKTVHLWDVARRTEVRGFPGHLGGVAGLAFSPDGRSLASGSEDTTLLVWDVYSLAEGESAPAAAGDLEALWAGLKADDGAAAFAACRRLLARPDLAGPFLEKKLRPVPAVDPKEIDRRVKDLNSDRFPVRRQAHRRLADYAELAEPALRRVLAENPAPELRRRVELLLSRVESAAHSPEALRERRALAVLEKAGTGPARRLLEALAAGAPQARLTRQARACLRRLRRVASAAR